MTTAAHPIFTDDMTLGAARAKLREYAKDGMQCPCCLQNVKVYRRKLNSTMARALLTLYRHGGTDRFVHAPSLPGDTHEISQFAWWKLVEEEDTVRPDGGRAGYWRCTPRGEAWLAGRATVPSHAITYNRDCIRLDGGPISFRGALGENFDYSELMEGVVFPEVYGQDSLFAGAMG